MINYSLEFNKVHRCILDSIALCLFDFQEIAEFFEGGWGDAFGQAVFLMFRPWFKGVTLFAEGWLVGNIRIALYRVAYSIVIQFACGDVYSVPCTGSAKRTAREGIDRHVEAVILADTIRQ